MVQRAATQSAGNWSARPLALVVPLRGREILAAVDAAAAATGLQPGLPLADARALCPSLRVVPQDLAGDAAALRDLALWCSGRYTPWAAPCPGAEGAAVESAAAKNTAVKNTAVAGSAPGSLWGPGGDAGLLLDITGCAPLFSHPAKTCPSKARAAGADGDGHGPQEWALLEDLLGRLQGLGFSARLGLADTPGAAWALARFATEPARPLAVAPPGELRRALAPLPPRALRLTAAQDELMTRFGLTRIDQLLDLPSTVLAPRFGRLPALRLAQALGEVGEAISPLEPPPRHLVRRIFAEPIAAPESIAGGLQNLLPGLCRQLERAQQGARQLVFTCCRVDGSLARLARRTSRPSRDPRHLARLFMEELARIDPGFGIDTLVLAAQVTEPLGAEQLRFEVPVAATAADRAKDRPAPPPGETALAALVDRLTARLGTGRVLRPWPRESHLPERAVALLPPFAKAPAARWQAGRLRPLRLLPRPEPIEATALLPDHPPLQFRWRRLLHRVTAAEGPERLSPEWWRSASDLQDQASLAGNTRDYFRVEDSHGHRYWIYRRQNRWYLHGLFS